MSGIVSKVLKMLIFPVLGGFSGVAHCCSSGFGRFRCFCGSCVCFSSLCCFCFCFVLFLVLWLDVAVLFFFFDFLFFVCFFGGFKGQVRWPFGPPHLALNPPYFIFWVFFVFCFSFVFFFVFCCFLFVFFEGLRVRWGGPKGHLTWP